MRTIAETGLNALSVSDTRSFDLATVHRVTEAQHSTVDAVLSGLGFVAVNEAGSPSAARG